MPHTLVERIRGRVEAGYWARLHCLLLIALASAAAFLLSVGLLALHVHSMALRYGIAAVAGYGVFVLLIRSWVTWKWSRLVPEPDLDLLNVSGDLPLPSRAAGTNVTSSLFRGGRSGGGGASGSWGAPRASASGGGKAGGFSFDIDGDDLFWLLVALAAALAGVTAIAYVIYVAPTLLAEAGINAAIAGKVYHGMRKREQHWTTDVLRRTGLAAFVLIVSAVLAGYALQRVAPDARSIGGVWAHLAHR
jgi:hypothetical protein